MPGPVHLVRLLALAVFLVLVALGLWLLDVRPALVIVGMVVALAIAWTIEWLAWSAGAPGARFDSLPREPARVAPPPPPGEPLVPEEPAPAEPPAGMSFAPEPAATEPEPERAPAASTEPRRRRLFARREPSAEGADSPTAPAPPLPSEAETPTEAAPVAPREPERPRPPEPEHPAPAGPDRRELLRGVPAPPPERPPPPQAAPPPAPSPVVPFRARPQTGPREWNLWDLERLARDETRRDPARRDEWAFLILHLRRFANADGLLPAEFDPLVRESFAGLLEHSQQT